MVGVNRFSSTAPPISGLLRINPEETSRQLERLNSIRQERDNEKAQATLRRLKDVAKGTENTLPPILECVEAYATIGEISDALRDVFGEFRESVFI